MPHLERFQTKSAIANNRIATMGENERKTFSDTEIRNINEETQRYDPPLPNLDTSDLDRPGVPSISKPSAPQRKSYHQEISPSSPNIDPSKRHIVGIFSRSSRDDYSWLVELLTSDYFRKTIQEVRPCYISNYGFQQFMDDLSQCTFGILYHTKKRGRINITDVSDSLYNEELDSLNGTLGRDRVIVLVDDLEDNSDEEKTRILKNQPSIGKWASDLLLISHPEKADKMQLEGKLKSIKQFCHPSEEKRRPQRQRPSLKDTFVPPPRRDIVIFSILEGRTIDWLRKLLSSEIFGHRTVTLQTISLHENGRLSETALQCKFGIIFHSMNSGRPINSERGFIYDTVIQQLSGKHGKDNVVLIIDDVPGGRERMWVRQFCSNTEGLPGDICPIFDEDKADEMKLVQKLKTIQRFRQMSEHADRADLAQPTPETLNTFSQKTSTSTRSTIGIFSVSQEDHISWLRSLLSLDIFGQRVVTYHKMLSYDNVGLEEGNLQCAAAILYHTMKDGPAHTQQNEFLYQKVTGQLVHKLGRDNVVVLIDDLRNQTDKNWAQYIESRIKKWAGDLLYIFHEEKFNKLLLVTKLKSLKLFRQPPADPIQSKSRAINTTSAQDIPVIGVFSRSEKSMFTWLDRLLSSTEFGNHRVIFHQISPDNKMGFQSAVSQCKFGILYHCMDRGHKHFTDLENSLYDEELQYLSTTIGKNRVIVVMDEMGNSDEESKSWILENQPSLGMLAREILLFNKSEKMQHEKPNKRLNVDRNLGTMYEKLKTLNKILREGMTSALFSSS